MSVLERPASKTEPRFPWVALIVLAAAVFLSVTSEMLPTGLLPDMGASLDASGSQIGLLVTIFAFTVVATSTPLSALTRRWPRHTLMIAILAVLAVSNLLTAISPNYPVVVGTRILGGIAHGMFWSAVGAYAGHLVPRQQIGRAVSITLGGGTLAFVFGVPIGTSLGHLFGWRLAFAAVGVLMLVAAVLIWRFLPHIDQNGSTETTDAAPGIRARRDSTIPAVLVVCLVTAVVMVGHYTFFTFVAPFLTRGMGVGEDDVGSLLFLYGIAGAVGLILAGSILSRRPQLGLVITIVVTAGAIAVLAVFAAQPMLAFPAFLLWGLAFGALPPLLQTRLLHASSAGFRDAASAIYTTGFNIGIGGGALVGAVLFDISGVRDLGWAYLGILVLALAIVLTTGRRRRA